MSQFENRSVQYPKRKKLTVNSVSYKSNGEIAELFVTEARNEGQIYKSGTELTAENMLWIINGYRVGETEFNVTPNSSSLAHDSVTINCNKLVNVDVQNSNQSYFSVSYVRDTSNNDITITVSAIPNSTQSSGSVCLGFSVTLYAQEGCKLGTINYTVNYNYVSN